MTILFENGIRIYNIMMFYLNLIGFSKEKDTLKTAIFGDFGNFSAQVIFQK